MYIVSQNGELTHCIAVARALGEFVRLLNDLRTHEHSPSTQSVSLEPQSIPWII